MSSWKRIASWKHNTEDMAADTAGRKGDSVVQLSP